MQYLRNLALVASMLCLGLSPALAMNHGGSGEEGEHGNHNGPPPPPQSMADIIEDILEEGDVTENAATMLGHLLMDPEELKTAGESNIDEEGMEAGKDEIAGLFEDLLDEEDLPEDAEKYINMMLAHMEDDHMGDEHMEDDHMGGCGG